MRLLAIIESIQNVFDCGIVIEALKNSFKRKWKWISRISSAIYSLAEIILN